MLHILFTTTVVSMIAVYMKMNKEQYILAMLIVVPLMIAHKIYLGEM